MKSNNTHRSSAPKKHRILRRIFGVFFALGALMAGTVAFAAWTSNGTGTGTATATTSKNLTVNVTNISGLYPTGTFNVPFTVTNPNPYAVTLSKVQLQSVSTTAVGCTASVVSGADLVDTDVIPAGGTSASRNFSVSMSNAAEDACQGAVFTLTLKALGASS
jgi:hypothetical protein